MRLFRWILVSFALLSVSAAAGQTVLVRGGKPVSRIVVADGEVNETAAQLLQRFVGESSGAVLPILHDVPLRKGDILLGAGETEGLTDDSFRLHTSAKGILCVSGVGKGVLYGAITLLERCLDMEYLAADTYTLDRRKDITVPVLDVVEKPVFHYRQTNAYGMRKDPVYKMFLRLEDPSDMFVDGLWVHTFNALLPSSRYGAEHPEYYSLINGERRPGRAGQWCLTNPEVFGIVAERIDSIFRANPGKNMISVSQNDGNYTFCRCEECEKVNEEEGSPSGNYIRFLNKLAERFPDKQFSTLAYLFTMKPPKHVRPLPNVNIMLCDIDCDREVPLTDNKSGREFLEALEGWSAISDNIFLWDYGINFDNMVAPFPNFPILKPNMELFRDHHVTMHFAQIGSAYGTDFSEMRSWIVAKLMWNPDQDTDELMLRFMERYYGAAAPYVYQYEKLLEGALLASGQRLWIYDSPASHKDGMLNAACRKRYGQLFDKAEAAVADDPELLRRVRLARLPLIYSNLEIGRTMNDKDAGALARELDIFEEYVTGYGVQQLDERNTRATEYCRLYRERYLAIDPEDLAVGSSVEWIVPPTGRYRGLGETALTDGLFGGSSFMDSWTGWEGIDGAFIIDLGDEKEFSSVETDFLHHLGAWILSPREVTYSVSPDKEQWEAFGHLEFPQDDSPRVKFVPVTARSEMPVRARYVKVEVVGDKICPSWHYGTGSPCWFFIDEVTIK